MKNYENVYILKGSLTEEQAKNEIEEIKKYFKNVKLYKDSSDILNLFNNAISGYQGKKNLAYEVKGEKQGYYFITYFEGTENKVKKIENQLKLNDNVLKFITIRV